MKVFFPPRQKILALVLVLVAVFFVFYPILGNQFTNWDDGVLLSDNPDIQELTFDNVKRMFTSHYIGTYVPLTVLSFAIEDHFFGPGPFVYYLNNLILHLLVVVLVFLLAQKLELGLSFSAITALIFGVHPMHVESVAWISQRKDVLYGFFYLLALYKYLEYIEKKQRTAFLWSVFFGLCSILAKPMAYSLPLILLLCDWWKSRPFTAKLFFEKVPFVFVIGMVSLITYTSNSPVIGFGWGQCLLIWAWVFCFHLQKFIFPYPLLPAYEMPQPIALNNPEYAVSVVFLMVLTIICFALRKQKWLWFALLFYALSNAMIIIRAVWDFGNNTIVADRFMYLPSLGICLALGAGYQFLRERFRVGWLVHGIFGVIVIAMIVLAALQTRVWENNITLWSHLLKYSPHRVLAYQNRAAGYSERKRYDEALRDMDRAIALDPRNAKLYYSRADIFEKRGDYTEALKDLDRSQDFDPDNANNNFLRGKIYQTMGRSDEAFREYGYALTKDPDLDRAYYNRGTLYDEQGQAELALSDYAQTLRINPRHKKVYNNRAVIYIHRGDFEKARVDLARAIEFDDQNAAAYLNRAIVFAVSGQIERAYADLDRCIGLDLKNTNAYYTRALLNYNLGKTEKVMDDLDKVFALDPSHGPAVELKDKVQR